MMTTCPHCSKKLDGHTAVDDSEAMLGPGDITVCVYCSEVCVYAEEGGLRIATAEEILEVNLVEIARAQRVARMFQKHFP